MTESEGDDSDPLPRRSSLTSHDEDDEEVMSGDDEHLVDSYISRDSVDGSSIIGSPNAPLSPAVTRRSVDSLALAGRPSIDQMVVAEESEEADELDLITEAAGRPVDVRGRLG